MQQATPAFRGPYVRLRPEKLDELAEERRLAGTTQIAELLGIDRASVHRVRSGESNPGERFIAAALSAFDVDFDDLFEIAEAS